MELGRVLRRKIVVLDGAMGTELIARGNKGVLELLNVDAPAEVEQVHEAYLRAGADIITTNTPIMSSSTSSIPSLIRSAMASITPHRS